REKCSDLRPNPRQYPSSRRKKSRLPLSLRKRSHFFSSLLGRCRGIPGHDAQRPASRRFHTARATVALARRLPPPNARERWPRLLPTSVEWVHLRSFHRWRDRWIVWGSSSLVGCQIGFSFFHEQSAS